VNGPPAAPDTVTAPAAVSPGMPLR